MLIPNQEVEMKWHSRNKVYYTNLGYKFTKINDSFLVKVEHLTVGAKPKVKIKCDYCGKIIERKWQNHINQYGKNLGDACSECKTKKCIKSNLLNYGVKNVLELEEHKEKAKQTCLSKYGVEHYSSTDEYKEKAVRTSLERYGETNYTKTSDYIEKTKKSSMEKYGFSYFTQCPEIKEKIKNTHIDRYDGMGYGSNIIQEKIKKSIFDKYGVESIHDKVFIDKSNMTCINKYGGIGFSSAVINTKIKNTMIDLYGTDITAHIPNIANKKMTTLCKNNKVATSKPQLKLYEMLKKEYKDCELNYLCDRFALDCVVFVNDIKIDFEYDGIYWHQDKQRDRRRDEIVKKFGYKIFRIKSKKSLPTIEQIKEKIDYLAKYSQSYTEIILDI